MIAARHLVGHEWVNQNSTDHERPPDADLRYWQEMWLKRLCRCLGVTTTAGWLLFGSVPVVPPPVAAASSATAVSEARYFVGVNVPWYNWGCDFGCADKTGVSSSSVQSALADGFGRIQSAGVHTVRWWTFEGDASQVERDASGMPTELNPAVYADFDAALALADRYELVYDFVLFSSPTAIPSSWLIDPTARERLANALAPLFERYKDHPRILAWEFFNEPEYDIWGNKVPLDAVQATVKLLASTVHARTSTLVTVGSATLEGVLMWKDLGLDFYSPHWYDQMSAGLQCARCIDVSTARRTYGIDGLPIVVGEFYGGPDVDTQQRLADFRAKGYAGGWAWSLFSDRTQDLKAVDLEALTKFLNSPAATQPAAPGSTPAGAHVALRASWVSPTYAAAGQVVILYQDVVSSSDMGVTLDFDVYDAEGHRVWQTRMDKQSVSANLLSSISTSLTVPLEWPAGQYTVKTRVQSADGGTRYDATDWAGTFIVEAAPPQPTPLPTRIAPDPQPTPSESSGAR